MKYKKYAFPSLIGALIFSIAMNLGQYFELKNYEDSLKIEFGSNLMRFSRSIKNGTSDENLNAEQYANITIARNALLNLNGVKIYPEEEYKHSLERLLEELHDYLLNDKERINKAFKDTDGDRLIFDIAIKYNSTESIKKVFKLLGE